MANSSRPFNYAPPEGGLPSSDRDVCIPPDDGADGVGSASFPEGTNRPDLLDQANKESRSPNEIFSTLLDFRAFPDDFLIINDVYLTDVPTASISIQSKTDVFVAETLRSPAPVVVSEGKDNMMIQISLVFPPGLPQTRDLKRIMSTLLVNPFVYIHNNRIKKALGVEELDTTMFALESGNLRSTGETVGVIILDLVLYFFNYKPFSKHHYYNAKMYGATNPRDAAAENTEEQNLPINLDEMAGYEPSSHSLSLLAQATQAKLRSGINYLKKAAKENVPVFLPSESDPWMYYADNLESSMPLVSPEPGDFLGFTVREYTYQNPPNNSATTANSTISNLLNSGYKPVHSIYNIQAGLATPADQGAFQSSGANFVAAVGSLKTKDTAGVEGAIAKTIRFTTVKAGGDTAEVPLFDDNGNIIQSSLQRVHEIGNKHIRDNRDKLPPTSPDLLRLVQQVANHYPGREWVINRIGSVPGGAKFSERSGHSAGVAMDFTIKGVNIFSIWEWVKKNLKQVMIGVYPNAGFLHIEYRPSYKNAYYYIELSKSGEAGLYVNTADPGKLRQIPAVKDRNGKVITKGVNYQIGGDPGKKITDDWWAANRSQYVKDAVADDKQEMAKESADKAVAKQNQEADKAAQRAESVRQIEIQKAVQKANENIGKYSGKTTDQPVKQKDFRDRNNWIEATEIELTKASGATAYYYYDDPKVRNMFYVDRAYDISSNPSLWSRGSTLSNGSVLPDLVCSAISISFGHRIAPLRCVGHSAPAWQFLGAGNKSGQIVLTFAGEAGKRSADYIKQNILMKARESARVFGSIIRDAGTIELRHTQYSTGDQNTILALANIKNIVVTGFEEFTSSESTDKWQLVIEFISQEFAEETLEKRFATTIDSKKKIVRAIMSKLFQQPYKLNNQPKVRIRPNGDIAYNSPPGSARPYIVNAKAPAWLADIVVRAAAICNEYEQELPPLSWKMTGASQTWTDVYNDWGAGKLFKGDKENIYFGDKERRSKQDLVSVRGQGTTIERINAEVIADKADQVIVDRENQGIFKNNGAPQTNRIHERLFERWLAEMEFLVRDVKKNLSDEEEFKKYFPGIADDIIDQITTGLGECYDDMKLPVIPGTAVPVPPEFYVYDDSSEDPFMANMSDPANMEKHLKGHALNEFESINRYLTGTLLGGSYLSKNMPRIREQRLAEIKRSEGEKDFWYYYKLARQGTKTWEPIYYRQDEANTGGNNTKWTDKVAGAFGGGTQEQQTLKFLENVTKLTSSLNEGRHWEDRNGEPDQRGVDEQVVKNLYGDKAASLSFGPNLDYAKMDEVIKGKAPTKNTDNLFPNQKVWASNTDLAKDIFSTFGKVGNAGQGVAHPTVNNATTLPDGTITIGQTEKEKEIENPGIFGQLEKGFDMLINALPNVIKIPLAAAFPALAPRVAKDLAKDAVDLVKDIKQAQDAARFEKYNHPIMEKFSRAKEAEQQAKTATRYAIAKRSGDLSMRRAYPTFKIYFIEDDAEDSETINGKLLRAFDDFYSYSAIQEIRVTRSRKVAGDIAVIRMTNIGGMLLRRRFGEEDRESDKKGKGGERQGIFADTNKEHPFEKMILQDGVKVQIRLGYAANPDHLTSVFLGQIVEISPSEDTKILEILCQGYGAELDNIELGPLENGSIFYSTQQALSAAIIQESIVTFGRRDRWNQDVGTAARHAWTGGRGTGILASLTPGNILTEWSNQKLDSLFQRYKFLNYPQDDNIYAPPPTSYTTSWEKFWDNACIYRPLKQTTWEIFKEHELRHPGYIAMAVPYGHDARMTMFFGSKMQHYWSRPPSELENKLSKSANDALVRVGGMGTQVLKNQAMKKLNELAGTAPSIAEAILKDAMSFGAYNHVGFALGELFGRYVPFRNYLYFDSDHHILKNEIRTSVNGTYNEIEVRYSEDEEDMEDADNGISQIKDYSGDKEEANRKRLIGHVNDVRQGMAGVLSCKLDENIPEYALRPFTAEYPSCVTSDMARRYAQGLFGRHLRDAYKGEFIVIGEERTKPYDICYLNDNSIGMYGPVEVEAVTHIFNRDNGFVSVITPDLCLEVNDYFTASSFDVTAAACQIAWADPYLAVGSLLAGPAAPAVYAGATALKGIGFLAAWAGVKFAMWTQDGAPVIATPLSLGGKPFMSMSLGPNQTSMITGMFGKWTQYWDDLSDAWFKFDLAEEVFEARINMTKGIFGIFGGDATGGSKKLLGE